MMKFEQLAHSPIFRGMKPDQISRRLSEIVYQVRRYGKDDQVVLMGQPVEALMIVQKGSVRGEMVDYSGRTLKIEDIEAPRPLASGFLFGNNRRFPVTVIANEEAEILVIPTGEFLKLMQHEQQILTNYLNAISSRTQFLSQKLHFLSFKSIREKVAHFLLQQAGQWLHSVELKQTQQQLADLFGVTRPALARVFGEMQREGLIEIDRKTILLKDRKGLNDLLKNG
ncbi:MAG TPA: Crp/Fnr family transcriptional regulator [Prolixibacteraceae bacterium]|nr:Crp/Fnr family transcriptional regulator [Prolixibacteraceae bacterium]